MTSSLSSMFSSTFSLPIRRYSRLLGSGIAMLACVAMLGGCASTPKPANIGIQISASSDVNPDLQGRPSPVILHVIELNSEEQFNRLDYMSLTQPSGAALGQDMLGKTRLILSPGDTKQLPLELNAQTTFIGFVAGFRDIDNAVWRTTVPVVQKSTKGITVTLTKQSITTAVQ